MKHLGHISTEGGPLLFLDRANGTSWHGINTSDYSEACDLLAAANAPGVEVTFGGYQGVAWDMATGTADVWRVSSSSVLLCRAWLDEAADEYEQQVMLATLATKRSEKIGTLTIDSGWLAMLWATGSGQAIAQASPADGRAFDLSVGDSGLVVALPPGRYVLLHDEVKEGNASAVRCHILPKG